MLAAVLSAASVAADADCVCKLRSPPPPAEAESSLMAIVSLLVAVTPGNASPAEAVVTGSAVAPAVKEKITLALTPLIERLEASPAKMSETDADGGGVEVGWLADGEPVASLEMKATVAPAALDSPVTGTDVRSTNKARSVTVKESTSLALRPV